MSRDRQGHCQVFIVWTVWLQVHVYRSWINSIDSLIHILSCHRVLIAVSSMVENFTVPFQEFLYLLVLLTSQLFLLNIMIKGQKEIY